METKAKLKQMMEKTDPGQALAAVGVGFAIVGGLWRLFSDRRTTRRMASTRAHLRALWARRPRRAK